MSKTVFGPVLSRRFGRSLGINIVPSKVCNLDCVYCEVGPTHSPLTEICSMTTWAEIRKPFEDALLRHHIDHITITGYGEPTLNAELKDIAQNIKRRSDIPLVLLTNSLLLSDPKVQSCLSLFAIISPSLDACMDKTFNKIDCPYKPVTTASIIRGLTQLYQVYCGKIWLEVLFIKGLNDSDEDIEALAFALSKIHADRVYLGTLSRRPATALREGTAEKYKALSYHELKKIQRKLSRFKNIFLLKIPGDDNRPLTKLSDFYKDA
jgi:wyosine [tRNA(Phe)-imidazoG37] synthetase (radical SAM superfamily)